MFRRAFFYIALSVTAFGRATSPARVGGKCSLKVHLWLSRVRESCHSAPSGACD